MDPLTQGLLGAVAAQAALAGPRSASHPGRRHACSVAGLVGGLVPDADVVLQPLADPAMPWELHRHFTHAIVLAPFLGLLVAGLLLLLVPRWRAHGGLVIAASIIGALTHAPLDLCTSYGTKILWPFSMTDWTLDLFPIVDPLFTLVLLIGTIAAWRRGSGPTRWVGAFLVLYVALALVQKDGAERAQAAVVEARGETPRRARVMPLPGSLLVWRSLVEVDREIVADLLRPLPFAATRGAHGGRRARLDVEHWADSGRSAERSRLIDVGTRLTRFADGWTTAGDRTQRLADARFSLGPGFEPLWGVEAHRDGVPAVTWWMAGAAWDGDRAKDLLRWIGGVHPELIALDEVARSGRTVRPMPDGASSEGSPERPR